VAVIVAAGLVIAPDRSPEIAALVQERERAARVSHAGMEVSQVPGIAAWRAAYRRFGIKQTRYRSSVERLLRNVLAGRDLPQINAFVDLYNAVSLAHVLPAGADDLDRITPPLAFRFARDGDTFFDMAEEGDAPLESSAPKPGEVVYADACNVLCRRWNWRQDARSLIDPATRRAVVTIQSHGWGDVEAAAADLTALLQRHCGATCAIAVLDRGRPAGVVG
jgi:DNA/RNA-binding domain of Phe-tRNA-synthetase-like protein